MKLFADENVDAAIVSWLRQLDHDVAWAVEQTPSFSDLDLLNTANKESRILLTNDLDFGELVFRQRLCACGVILLRLRGTSQEDRLSLLQSLWPVIEVRASGHFTVVRNRRVRVRPMTI